MARSGSARARRWESRMECSRRRDARWKKENNWGRVIGMSERQ